MWGQNRGTNDTFRSAKERTRPYPVSAEMRTKRGQRRSSMGASQDPISALDEIGDSRSDCSRCPVGSARGQQSRGRTSRAARVRGPRSTLIRLRYGWDVLRCREDQGRPDQFTLAASWAPRTRTCDRGTRPSRIGFRNSLSTRAGPTARAGRTGSRSRAVEAFDPPSRGYCPLGRRSYVCSTPRVSGSFRRSGAARHQERSSRMRTLPLHDGNPKKRPWSAPESHPKARLPGLAPS
jgi:hypothetical protein